MRESEQELLNDLRAVAERSASGAPPAVRERLLVEFRRRSARKRLMARWRTTGAAAIAAALLLTLLSGDARRFLGLTPAEPNSTAESLVQNLVADATDGEFYPLPEAEGLPPVESATVIRVQMPVASLQLMGLPVHEDGGAGPVQADILLGQDGLARGVRLVQ